MMLLKTIADHLTELGHTDHKLVSETVLQIGTGAITYDPIWGYVCNTQRFKTSIGELFKVMQLIFGDCLEVLKTIPDASVDAVVTDPPYGILKHKIETAVDLPTFFTECQRVLKPNSFLVYFGQQPTLTQWNSEAFKLFTYKSEIIWYKRQTGSHLSAIMRVHEKIMLFS